jgi:hypothetical protein
MTEKVTYGTVWDELSQVDCSEHTEKKGKLTYLSWAWAWGVLMEHYPTATYALLQHERYYVLPRWEC